MKTIHLSYNHVPEYNDPEAWLKRISFSTGILESMVKDIQVIAIYNINYKGILSKMGVTYHFPGFSRWHLILPVQFNRYVKRLNPDLVVVHGLFSPWQVIMLRWQMGGKVKIIAQHHAEPPLRDVRQYLQRWADRYIDAYLFCSFDLGQLWVEKRQIRNPKKIKELMEASSSFYVVEKESAKAVTKVSGEIVFLWVGSLDVNKDPMTVVRAFIHFARANPSARLYMIYQTFELLNELVEWRSNTPGASDFITLVGKVNNDQLLYWYNSADFIISSSHYEGSGIAVCEALSCGCIPILTSIPSFRMMTDRGRIGLLYNAGDEEALLASLIKSLEFGRKEMKLLVLERFKTKLSFDAIAGDIVKVINDL